MLYFCYFDVPLLKSFDFDFTNCKLFHIISGICKYTNDVKKSLRYTKSIFLYFEDILKTLIKTWLGIDGHTQVKLVIT